MRGIIITVVESGYHEGSRGVLLPQHGLVISLNNTSTEVVGKGNSVFLRTAVNVCIMSQL